MFWYLHMYLYAIHLIIYSPVHRGNLRLSLNCIINCKSNQHLLKSHWAPETILSILQALSQLIPKGHYQVNNVIPILLRKLCLIVSLVVFPKDSGEKPTGHGLAMGSSLSLEMLPGSRSDLSLRYAGNWPWLWNGPFYFLQGTGRNLEMYLDLNIWEKVWE